MNPRGVKREHEQTQEKQVVVERVRRDFFGRVVVEERDDGKKRRMDLGNGLRIQPKVWVKYHEGYSNAVRKPVIFAELLGRI